MSMEIPQGPWLAFLESEKQRRSEERNKIWNTLSLAISVPLAVLGVGGFGVITWHMFMEDAKSEQMFSLAEVYERQSVDSSEALPMLAEVTVAAEELGISATDPKVWQDGSKYYIAFEDAQVGEADQYAVECSYLEEPICIIPEKETLTGE